MIVMGRGSTKHRTLGLGIISMEKSWGVKNHTSSRLPRSDLALTLPWKIMMKKCILTVCEKMSTTMGYHGYLMLSQQTSEYLLEGHLSRCPLWVMSRRFTVAFSAKRRTSRKNPKWLFQTCPTPFFVNLPTCFSEVYVVETVWNSSRPLLSPRRFSQGPSCVGVRFVRNDVLPERKEPEPIGSLAAVSLIDDPRDAQKKSVLPRGAIGFLHHVSHGVLTREFTENTRTSP